MFADLSMEHPKKKKRRKDRHKAEGKDSLGMDDTQKSDEVPSLSPTKLKISFKSTK